MREYWYLWLVFAALVVLTAVITVFAGKALSSHNAETKRLLAEIDRLKALKDKFKDLSSEKAENADSKELLEGVTAVLQAKVEKADDGEAEFSSFNEAQKYIYTLNYFAEDAADSLSFFFKNNGPELTDVILPALEAIGAENITPFVRSEHDMFDENNEAASIDSVLLEENDKKFAKLYIEKELCDKVKNYIKSNIDKF